MKILVIQTAFIGDVILATPVLEALRASLPGATIDMLLRRGNESLLAGHPHLRRLLIWEKKKHKYRSLLGLLGQIRAERYDLVINCQRFGASGFLTVFSGARCTVGFDKNPFSRLFTHRVPHIIDGRHEVERNLALVECGIRSTEYGIRNTECGVRSAECSAARDKGSVEDESSLIPDGETPHSALRTPHSALRTPYSAFRIRLYPSPADFARAQSLAGAGRYVCVAPTSVWRTKEFPEHKWLELLRRLPADCAIFLLGAPGDHAACERIRAGLGHDGAHNLAGQLSLLESAALMAGAGMNYVNDSAPLHLASAMNAPAAAVFCSTVPAFGFGPLSDKSWVVETRERLDCRPCGLHGYRACPKGHFACAETIRVEDFPNIP